MKARTTYFELLCCKDYKALKGQDAQLAHQIGLKESERAAVVKRANKAVKTRNQAAKDMLPLP